MPLTIHVNYLKEDNICNKRAMMALRLLTGI
jgi:hypothetical protein